MERADRQLEICPDQAPGLRQYARHGTKRQQRIRSGYRDRGGARRGAPAPDRGQLTLPVGISIARIQLNPGGEKASSSKERRLAKLPGKPFLPKGRGAPRNFGQRN